MKVSTRGEYSLRALITLASNSTVRLTLGEISKATLVSPPYLEKILSQLRILGYINSKRGTRGGFQLQIPPREIIIGDVIRKLEGPLAPMNCVSVTSYKACALEGNCMLKPLWGLVRDTVADVLDRTTLADLVERRIG